MQIEDYYKLVYSVANRYRSKRLDHDDIVQAGMLGLVQAWQTYDATKAMFSTYAYVCIRNAIRVSLRGNRNERQRDMDLLPACDSMESISIDAIVAMLPYGDKELILSRYRDGKSVSEIAKPYGISRQAMNARIGQILKRLRLLQTC